MALARLHRRYDNLRGNERDVNNGRPNAKPDLPWYKPVASGGNIASFAIGGFLVALAGVGLFGFITEEDSITFGILFAIIVVGAVGGLFLYGAWQSVREKREYNEKKAREYEQAMERYRKIDKLNTSARTKLPAIQSEINKCLEEKKKLDILLYRVYGANIIPSRYRNIYVAVYLYDWFSTSNADDLDHALSMFVLEEIKDRLDTIIENQSQMILNQQIMIANQQKSIEQQRSYESMMRTKLNQIQATQEERLSYTRMIESNTAVSAYFAAAEYIRKI